MLDQFPSFVFFLCFIYLSVSFFGFVSVSFSTKTFTFRKFPCAVQISQQNLYMGVCLVEDWGFRPGGVHSHLLPHNLYSNAVHIVGNPGRWVPLGNSLAFIKLHKTRFLGPFGIPTQTFTFLISPITISFSSKTKHQAKLSVTGQYYCRDQTVTERPVRPRVSAPTIMHIRAYVYLCHTPVTLIKSTYY